MQEDVTIPKGKQKTIAVRTIWPNLQPKAVNWTIETSEVGPDLVMPRTLLEEENFRLAVRIMNITDHNYNLKAGTYIQDAEKVEICNRTDQPSPQEDYRTTDFQMLNPEIGKAHHKREYHTHTKCYQNSAERLTKKQRKRKQRLIGENADIFSKSEFDIGRTAVV